MKLAIFNEDTGNSHLNMQEPEKGNPGIGGIDYRLWSMPYYLNKKHSDVTVQIYLQEQRKYPASLPITVVSGIKEAARLAKEDKADFFLIRNKQSTDVYQYLERLKLPTILTAGNFSEPYELDIIASCKYIKAFVCVSRQQYQMLRDEAVYSKATYIFNAIDCYAYKAVRTKKQPIVAFLGGVYPVKGFHILAKSWANIKKKVPDAQLYVIGSGKLYSKNKKLGKYGLAQEDYEKTFIHYLLDENKKIRKDVTLHGTLGGEDKLRVMNQAKVGVVNPSGKTETFGYSAIEFEVLGIPVVTKATNGFFDTVQHKMTGLLFHTQWGMEAAIVRLLKDDPLNRRYGKNGVRFVRSQFDINYVAEEWYQLFQKLSQGQSIERKTGWLDARHNWIWVREINRWLGQKLSWYHMPSVNKIVQKSE